MAIHPLRGIPLQVVYMKRNHLGQRFVVVEVPQGNRLVLPVAWTDLVPPVTPVSVGGLPVRLLLESLVKLAQAVRILQKVDNNPEPFTVGASLATAGASEASDGPGPGGTNLDRPRAEGKAEPSGGVGDAGGTTGARASERKSSKNGGGER